MLNILLLRPFSWKCKNQRRKSSFFNKVMQLFLVDEILQNKHCIGTSSAGYLPQNVGSFQNTILRFRHPKKSIAGPSWTPSCFKASLSCKIDTQWKFENPSHPNNASMCRTIAEQKPVKIPGKEPNQFQVPPWLLELKGLPATWS